MAALFSRIQISIVLTAFFLGPLCPGGDFNEKTIITFRAPVEIPGQALPAGTYVFKIIDSSTQNNVVQVLDQTERHLFATFLAIPDHRNKPAAESVIFFEERPSDTPEAVRALICRGDSYAREFVYPHSAALAIAKRTHQKVLQLRDATTGDLKGADVTSIDETGGSSPIKK